MLLNCSFASQLLFSGILFKVIKVTGLSPVHLAWVIEVYLSQCEYIMAKGEVSSEMEKAVFWVQFSGMLFKSHISDLSDSKFLVTLS